jgi:5-bromo-4-chloroindolyl phosphate hydrolysis protein
VIIMTVIFIAVILKMILISMIITMRMMRARGKPRSAAMVAAAAAHSACVARVKHYSRLQLQQLLRLLAGRA